MNDGEDETEVDMAKHDWDQLREGVSHGEYVLYDDIIMCQVQTLDQIMDEKFTSDVFDYDDDDYGGGGGGGCGSSSGVSTGGHRRCKEIAHDI